MKKEEIVRAMIAVLGLWGYKPHAAIPNMYIHSEFSDISTNDVESIQDLMYVMHRTGQKDKIKLIKKALEL